MKKIVFGVLFWCFFLIGQVCAAQNPIREIVLDTETTGLSFQKGDKIVEIAAVELVDHVPTGKTFQQYINPQRDMPQRAFEIHGLSAEFLSQYPPFLEIAPDFLAFVGDDSVLIAHNAPFDMGFINHELEQNGFETLEKHKVIDTLGIAQKKFPKKKRRLDDLCTYFDIDKSQRTKHGALLDAELLAEVYLKLLPDVEYYQQVEDTIRKAIAENKKLKIIYHSHPKYDDKITERTVIPHRIVTGKVFKDEGIKKRFQDNALYLEAFCELDNGERVFKVERIQKIEMLP